MPNLSQGIFAISYTLFQQCKRQEDEIVKLRRSLEDAARQQDDALNVARLRHNQELNHVQEEVDILKKTKARYSFYSNLFVT